MRVLNQFNATFFMHEYHTVIIPALLLYSTYISFQFRIEALTPACYKKNWANCVGLLLGPSELSFITLNVHQN